MTPRTPTCWCLLQQCVNYGYRHVSVGGKPNFDRILTELWHENALNLNAILSFEVLLSSKTEAK